MKFKLPDQQAEYNDEYRKNILCFGTVFVMHTWVDGEFFAEIIPLSEIEIEVITLPPTKELN